MTRLTKALISSIILYFLSLTSGLCQLNINVSYGIQIPGKQDLKYRYYEDGILIKNLITNNVASTVSPISNISVTYWLKAIGFDLSLLQWKNKSEGIRFQTKERPPFTKIDAERQFLVLSFLARTSSIF